MSLADHYQASVADIRVFLTRANSDDGLFESFEALFGPAKSEWDYVCWFHLTSMHCHRRRALSDAAAATGARGDKIATLAMN